MFVSQFGGLVVEPVWVKLSPYENSIANVSLNRLPGSALDSLLDLFPEHRQIKRIAQLEESQRNQWKRLRRPDAWVRPQS